MTTILYKVITHILIFTRIASTVSNISQTPSIENVVAPLEFPKNESLYKFVQNPSILLNLSHAVSEVDDLIHGGVQTINETTKSDSSNNIVVSDKEVPNLKDETEFIQTGGNEDDRFGNKGDKANIFANTHGSGEPLVRRHLAVILAAVFVVIAAIGYVGLFLWKRYLGHRHGNRQMLVNEADFNDTNDMGHFSL